MKRPFIVVLAGYAAGLMGGEFFHLPLTLLFAAAFAVLLPTFFFDRLRLVTLWILLALAGWTNLELHRDILSPDDLRTLAGRKPALAAVRGSLTATPRLKLADRNHRETIFSMAEVKVSALRLANDWEPASGEIMVASPGAPGAAFFGGQTVEISGVIEPPPPPLAAGLFDYRDYLQTRGIYYELKVESTNDWQLGAAPRARAPLTDRFMAWAKETLALGLPVEDEPLRLLWAMTLGWRTAFSGDIGDPFLQAGTMHMFAIDGLRIALFSGMLIALMRGLQISRAWCGAVTIPIIWFYTAATGWESPALRASLMMTIVLGGWALKRPVDLLNSLACAAFFILVCEPRQLFEASFQLSFFVMLTIGLMLPVLNELSDSWLQHDPLLPQELVPGWQQRLLWLGRRFARFFALAFAAWAGSLPLSIKYFHLCSLVSTPANLLAVPLGTAALMANLGALISGSWLPAITVLFNHAAWFFMVAMTWVSVQAAKLPAAYFYLPEIGWPVILSYYTGIVILFGGWLKTARANVAVGIAFLLIVALFLFHLEFHRTQTCLTILPLEGGRSIYIADLHRSNDLLVDCGDVQGAESTLKDYLRAQGVNSLPELVLTTGDVRNSGGAGTLDRLFGIGKLWTGPGDFPSSRYRKTVATFDAEPPRHGLLRRGDTIAGWKVLAPGPDQDFSRSDDKALVLQRTFYDTQILLLSDLGRAGQKSLLEHPEQLRADIVVSGLPANGDGEPLGDDLIHAIQPRAIIITDSEYPAQRRADPGLRARLQEKSIPVIYTRDLGGIDIVIDRHGWRLSAVDGMLLQETAK